MPLVGHISQSWIETTSGFVAGVASTLVVHPLDVVKTRLQGNSVISWTSCSFTDLTVDATIPFRFGNSIRIIRELLQSKQSTVTALYRGLSPNLIGNSVSWALYFVWYDKTKSYIKTYHGRKTELSYHDFFLAAGVAGKSRLQSPTHEAQKCSLTTLQEASQQYVPIPSGWSKPACYQRLLGTLEHTALFLMVDGKSSERKVFVVSIVVLCLRFLVFLTVLCSSWSTRNSSYQKGERYKET